MRIGRLIFSAMALILFMLGATAYGAGWNRPVQCNKSTLVAGNVYNPTRPSHIYLGPSAKSGRLINERATESLGHVDYSDVDESLTVREKCVVGDWSYIETIDPVYLSDRAGWVRSTALRPKATSMDPYAGKIVYSSIEPYKKSEYPRLFYRYGVRIKEIEQMRIVAAKIAIDSRACGRVFFSELSDQSRLGDLRFYVECSDGSRKYYSEGQLSK